MCVDYGNRATIKFTVILQSLSSLIELSAVLSCPSL
jgi:hypothetical protein